MMFDFLLGAVALTGVAQPEAPQPDLSWLAGYWLECGETRKVAETWSAPTGAIQLGHSITIGKKRVSWEQMRIETRSGEGGGVVFLAQPGGVAATAFPMVRAGPNEVVFENKAHDFPQRIVYRREGNRLTGTISDAEGKNEMRWTYEAAPFNTGCP